VSAEVTGTSGQERLAGALVLPCRPHEGTLIDSGFPSLDEAGESRLP